MKTLPLKNSKKRKNMKDELFDYNKMEKFLLARSPAQIGAIFKVILREDSKEHFPHTTALIFSKAICDVMNKYVSETPASVFKEEIDSSIEIAQQEVKKLLAVCKKED